MDCINHVIYTCVVRVTMDIWTCETDSTKYKLSVSIKSHFLSKYLKA